MFPPPVNRRSCVNFALTGISAANTVIETVLENLRMWKLAWFILAVTAQVATRRRYLIYSREVFQPLVELFLSRCLDDVLEHGSGKTEHEFYDLDLDKRQIWFFENKDSGQSRWEVKKDCTQKYILPSTATDSLMSHKLWLINNEINPLTQSHQNDHFRNRGRKVGIHKKSFCSIFRINFLT